MWLKVAAETESLGCDGIRKRRKPDGRNGLAEMAAYRLQGFRIRLYVESRCTITA